MESLKEKKYDLIFIDINLKDIDGVQTVKLISKEIKSSELETEMPKIIATGSLEEKQSEIEKFLFLGMNDYISKPVSAEKLKNIITKTQ